VNGPEQGDGSKPVADLAPVAFPMKRTQLFDPPPELGSLRAEQPLCPLRYPDGEVGWLVSNYALSRALLKDSRLGMRPKAVAVGDPEVWSVVFEGLEKTGVSLANLLELDPPDHTRYRRLLGPLFTRSRVDEQRDQIEAIVTDTLDAMQEAGPPVDLVKMFATPIAASTQCVTLGAPVNDGDQFLRFPAAALSPNATEVQIRAAFQEFTDYLEPLIEQKRREPGDDIISYIVRQEELSTAEIFSIIAQLFIGGHSTVEGMLALSVFVLLTNPEQLKILRDDPSAIDKAVDELLRYATIFQIGAATRVALEDIEVGDAIIREGEGVTVSLAAADRDPDRFTEPDTLDLRREQNAHLAFGQGIHMCLGQHFARLEMKVGLSRLIERFPTLRLAVPVEAVEMAGDDELNYGVRELPVAW